MGLAGAAVADQHDGLGALDVAPVGELADLRRRHLRRLAEVELVQGFDARQVRVLEPARDRVPLALVDLGGEQRFQIAEAGVALALSGPPPATTACRTRPRSAAAGHSGPAPRQSAADPSPDGPASP